MGRNGRDKSRMVYSEDMDTLLCEKVLIKGAWSTKKVKENWDKVVHALWLDEDYQRYPNPGSGNYRNVREHFGVVKRRVVNFMEGGNTSVEDGDLSKMYKAVREIVAREEEEAAQKEAEIENKRVMDETNDVVLEGDEPDKTKPPSGHGRHADGRFAYDTTKSGRGSPRISQAWDQAVTNFMQQDYETHSGRDRLIIPEDTLSGEGQENFRFGR